MSPRAIDSHEIGAYTDLAPIITSIGRNDKRKIIYDYLRLLHLSQFKQDFPDRVQWKKLSQNDFIKWPIEDLKLYGLENKDLNIIMENLHDIQLKPQFLQNARWGG